MGTGFNEAIKNKVVLRNDSPIAVATFLDWSYGHTPVVDVKTMSNLDIISIYCFADTACSEAYHNDLMDAIRKSCKEANSYPEKVIVLLSEAGLMESPLLKFLLDGWVSDMMKFPQSWIEGKLKAETAGWSIRPEVMMRLLASIWEYQRSPPAEKPSRRVGCYYHTHADGNKCTALPSAPNAKSNGVKVVKTV